MNNIPEGYKLVPVEPTEAMNHAGDMDYSWNVAKIYRAMLAAAPTPPQPIYDEAKERELFEASVGPTLAQRGAKGDYLYVSTRSALSGWLACARSRAKAGEDE
ncbi:hypothetical protein ACM9HO_03330 [Pseudomonas sp. KHB2.9]